MIDPVTALVRAVNSLAKMENLVLLTLVQFARNAIKTDAPRSDVMLHRAIRWSLSMANRRV